MVLPLVKVSVPPLALAPEFAIALYQIVALPVPDAVEAANQDASDVIVHALESLASSASEPVRQTGGSHTTEGRTSICASSWARWLIAADLSPTLIDAFRDCVAESIDHCTMPLPVPLPVT